MLMGRTSKLAVEALAELVAQGTNEWVNAEEPSQRIRPSR